ncbi:MAG: phage integrase SAM-like domain-containing protein, partial [Actinomycetota bacterium]|nr:phage integrase SAM-like domain-containing protein [Actinomycetota bacterium]
EAYLAHLGRKGRDGKTTTRNRHSLARLNSWLRELEIDPISASELVLEEYVAWLASTFAETTASRETTHLKAAFRYAVRLGTLKQNPAAEIVASIAPVPSTPSGTAVSEAARA